MSPGPAARGKRGEIVVAARWSMAVYYGDPLSTARLPSRLAPSSTSLPWTRAVTLYTR